MRVTNYKKDCLQKHIKKTILNAGGAGRFGLHMKGKNHYKRQ